MRLGRFSRPRVRFQCSATQPRQAAPSAGSKPQPTEWRQESGARRRAARNRGKRDRVYVCTAAPGVLVRAGSGPGRQRPGGGGRAVRVGQSCLTPSADKLARACGQIVSALLCALGRQTPRPAGGTQCQYSLSAHRTPAPRGNPAHYLFSRRNGAGSGRWFLQASVGAGDAEWDPLLSLVPSSAAHPSAALCLQPSANLGRSMGKATHLEGPEGSQGK